MTWPFLPHHIAVADFVIVFHLALNVGDGKPFRGAAGEVALEHAAHVVERQVGVVGERHLIDDLGDGAFQFADIRAGVLGDVHLNITRDGERRVPFAFAVFLDEAFYDAELRLDFRRLDVEGSARVESGDVALVDINVFRCAVGGKNNLFSLVSHLVEYLKHDIERLFLALEVLHVVDEQHIGFLVALLEVAVARFFLVMCHRGFHIIREQLCGIDVGHLQLRSRLVDVVLDRAQKVRFPQPALAVDEKRIEVHLAGGFRNIDGHRVSHSVGVADDEVFESEGGRPLRAFVRGRVRGRLLLCATLADRRLEMIVECRPPFLLWLRLRDLRLVNRGKGRDDRWRIFARGRNGLAWGRDCRGGRRA